MPEQEGYQYELPLDEQSRDVMDYLSESSWRYGLEELKSSQSLTYFLPLLRELFNVSDSRTRVVFTMLHTLMLDDRIRWTRAELDEKFHWLKDGQRNYLLQRMSNVGWLEYYRDQSVYMTTDKGETLMRILSRFVHGEALVENEGAALAEIEFSMLLDLDDLPDRLKFLRNRLVKHNVRATSALKSDSAYRILEVFQQLQSAYRWAEQTRETLDQIDSGSEDPELWNSIRGVHSHLSELHSQISEMQLVLQAIQKKQINISKYGLTHLDFDKFLIHSSVDHLADIMSKNLNKIPHPFFLVEDFAFAEAEEILGREILEKKDARGWETEVSDLEPDTSDQVAYETQEFAQALSKATKKWTGVETLMDAPRWEVAAYRFSLLTMMADLHALGRAAEATADPLINQNIITEFDQSGETVGVDSNGESWTMSKGRFRRKETQDNDDE